MQYKEGIESLNSFIKILEESLKEALPGVKLSKESAFAWRGYQIEKYPGLKDSQYYCQIYLGTPEILAFFEYYDMSHYPFQVEFNLLTNGFFNISDTSQKELLVGFIKMATNEAINWNQSQKRQEIVSGGKQ
jgi:hypothetical protein